VGSRRYKVIFALDSFMVQRISKLIELNDGISKLAFFKFSINVTYARRIINFSRLLGRTSGHHKGDHVDWISL